MAKKTHIKVRLVPESKPDSSFFYYVKNLLVVRKLKLSLKQKNITHQQKNMKCL